MRAVTRTQGRSEPHTDVSLWFVFDGSSEEPLTADATEFAATRWWPFDAIVTDGPTPFDPNLPRFLQKLRAGANA